ncbi:MAG: hypothetical protein ABI654_01045 [Betaproteobacteria bacterium]
MDWRLTAGAARTFNQDGARQWSTPFQLRALFDRGRSAFKVSGDGISSVRAADGNRSGLSDVNVVLSRALAVGLIGEVGLTMPAGGEVGSDAGRKRIGAAYNRHLAGHWDAQVQYRLVRFDADQPAGVSRFRHHGLLQAAYNFDTPRTALTFQIARNYRHGAGGATQAAATFEYPLREGKRPPIGALGLTRGLSAGSRDTTLEIDVSIRF